MVRSTSYRYVGPAELLDHVPSGVGAIVVNTGAALNTWLSPIGRSERGEPLTYVVALDGALRLGPRRSEHVRLAAGRDVLAAGEITFTAAEAGWQVSAVSNQSTGYCPDPDCWPAVAYALDQLGIQHPGDFTDKVIFRRCSACRQRNIVRDGDFTCALCDSNLPTRWNFTSP